MKPLVSVVVPVFNVAEFLVETIKSVRQQTYQEWEMIIVDDGSTDSSGDIAEAQSLEERRIRMLHQTNQGVSVARNNGLDHANGEYVIFLDADDLWQPHTLQALVDTAIFSGQELVYGKQNTLRINGNIDIVYDDYPRGNILLAALQKEMVHIGGTLITKGLLVKSGIRFANQCRLDEDTEFIWKLLAIQEIAFTPQVVLTRRDRIGSASGQRWNWGSAQESISAYSRLQDFLFEKYREPDRDQVLETVKTKLNYRRLKAVWNLIKQKKFEQAKTKMMIPAWNQGIRDLPAAQLTLSQSLERRICLTQSSWVWKSLAGFLS